MPRPRRVDLGGYVYHVLNRANGRMPIFRKEADFDAFLRILAESLEHVRGMRLLGYCLMPNHWHLVLWPRKDGELSDFMHWLTLTHTQRWRAHHHDVGCGHLYQGRYKSFPIAHDDHYFTVLRYAERNALRAGLVAYAEAWAWGSLAQRLRCANGVDITDGEKGWPKISVGPLPLPSDWVRHVNKPQSEAELESLRRSVQRGQPFGADLWARKTAARMNLESTLRSRGRPRRPANPSAPHPEKGS
jgi:putative transposase